MLTPTIETKRLILRPMKANDAEEVFRNWASDPEVAKFMRWSTHEDVTMTREWLQAEENEVESDEFYDWGIVLKETGELIGSGGLSWRADLNLYELGYNLMKKYWGQGLMTEAAEKMVEFGIKDLKQKKLYCCYAKENIASGKVMEKVGFKYQYDAEYQSWDKSKTFESREYLLEVEDLVK